jgi:hypothetical protein
MEFRIGTTLYHGTVRRLPSGFPNRPSGNWFATDPLQSILHALSSAGRVENKAPYLYIYKVIRSPKIISFATANNFNRYAKGLGFKLPKGMNTFAFESLNYNIAKRLCENKIYNGWWFPADQTQVMLCDPSKFLKFVKVLEIKRPEKGFYRVRWNNGMFSKYNKNKFTTVPAKLNNINKPSTKSLYYTGSNNDIKFFNSNGNPANVNRSTKNTLASYSSALNEHKARIIANRIKVRTGQVVNFRKIRELPSRNK